MKLPLVNKACIAILGAFLIAGMAGLGSIAEITIAMDTDNDGISDACEIFFGLNPTNSADASLDYDGDALTNLAESVKLTDPFCEDTDRDGFSDLIDINAVSRAYFHWGDPEFTTGDQYEYAHPDWLLGAYKVGGEWLDVSEYGSNGVSTAFGWYVSSGEGSLCVDLDRSILTNNLRYALNFGGRAMASLAELGQAGCAVLNSSLFVDLLDTNGVVVAENLFGNLLAVSNASSCVVLNIPTAKFPDAAVIQLRVNNCSAPLCGAGDDKTATIYEGLLYIDEDGDGLDADQEKQIGTSDYCLDSNHNGTNDYDECFANSSTNSPGRDDGDEDDDGDEHDGHKGKIIYVDQAIGNDSFTGRAPAVLTNKKGPKKTVRGGLSIAGTNDTIIIRSGDYNENLDIRGRPGLKVKIEGKVRL